MKPVHDDHYHANEQAGTGFRWVAFFALVVVLLTVGCVCAGCVSQGEFDEALAQIDTMKAQAERADKLRLLALQDLAEAEACIDALLEYIEADERRTRRYLFGGAR